LQTAVRILVLIVLLVSGHPAFAQDESLSGADTYAGTSVRIGRPASDNQYDYPILSSFLAWRFRYVRPVFCRMVICNSSCARFRDGCDASALDPVLTEVAGHGCATSGCQSGGCAMNESL
jgi:hypothetical protein